jgi:hypothetical protein
MLRTMSLAAAIGTYFIAALLATLCCSITVVAMVDPSPPPRETSSRRSLLTRMPFLVFGATASLSIGTASPTIDIPFMNSCDDINCGCTKCQHNDQNSKYQATFGNNNFVANAYERRDVGDETSSGETKAMNDQAYETNNRLERDGLVLEVRHDKPKI